MAVSPAVIEQTLLDVRGYFNANLGIYLGRIDSRLAVPEFGIGSRNLVSATKYPAASILQDPGASERAGNYIADLTLSYNIGISLTASRPDTVELHMARYADAALHMVLENPTLGGICYQANIPEWEMSPPDPEGKHIGLVVLTLELVLEVTTAA